ncbi:MAG: hypothetical protein E4H09_01670, partial [Spirochaetales bacterium]
MDRAVAMVQQSILGKLGEEVDLVVRYGSSHTQATHPYSDLDISYVPVHESTWDSITVMVNEVMIDCYPIHWSRLEAMAEFDDPSATVLLRNQIVYQANEEAAQRFRSLPERMAALQRNEARPEMLGKAMLIFRKTGYQYYLLRKQAEAGHRLSCLHHARNILSTVVHCVMVCNQACIDTRKRDQVLSLRLLPAGFGETLADVVNQTDPHALLMAVEHLLATTRSLLLSEQTATHRSRAGFPEVLDSAYPELKGDLQHLMLACERGDMYNSTLTSLLHELMIHMAQVVAGVEYSEFNTVSEY